MGGVGRAVDPWIEIWVYLRFRIFNYDDTKPLTRYLIQSLSGNQNQIRQTMPTLLPGTPCTKSPDSK